MQRPQPRISRRSGSSQRLFFALWPDVATRLAISEAVRTIRGDNASSGRWIEARRYHLTLQFLGAFGELPQSLSVQACTAAAELDAAGFELTLDRVGSFSNRSIVWWLGCQTPPPLLLELWHALGASLARHWAWQQPPAFTPHVTILRGAGRSVAADTAAVSWPVRSFALVRSRQSEASSDYEVIGEWPLRAG